MPLLVGPGIWYPLLSDKVLYQRVYEAGANVGFCRVLTFEDDDRNCIPAAIAGLHTFDANRDVV
ncbi:MAG: hypothetical protein ABFS02_09370 [Pseudomonadota bacterium]